MIYVNGCSYTFGIGTMPHDTPDACLSNAWPAHLSELLNKEIINEALPGSCNTRIFRDTIIQLSKETPELVIVMWSDAARTEIFKHNEGDWYREIFDLYQVTPQGVSGIKDYFHREALESYYSFIHTDAKSIIDTLTMMLAVKELCAARGIPYIAHVYKSNLERKIRHTILNLESSKDATVVNTLNKLISLVAELEGKYIYGVNSDMSFDKLCVDNHLPYSEYSMGHPGREGHIMMADWFKEVIEENDLVS